MSDRVTLTDYEARRLLNAIVKEFVQMTAEELEQQATEGNRYGRQHTRCPQKRGECSREEAADPSWFHLSRLFLAPHSC